MLLLFLLLLTTLLRGAECQSTFANPLRRHAPDPAIVYSGGYYHMTHTSGDRITIIRAKKLAYLAHAEPKTVWTDRNPSRNANMWAPEMHRIDKVWYMFYSSCQAGASCCHTCRTRVLRGCDADGPYDCNYSFLADLVPPWNQQAGKKKRNPFSIDGTYLEIPTWGRYHVLSVDGDKKRTQALAIAKLNTDNWTVGRWSVFSWPSNRWEKNVTGSDHKHSFAVNEAPHPLYHGDDIFLAFSASHCSTPNYSIGLLKYQGGDPLKGKSWVKSGPHLQSGNGNYGTGHNSFFKSPDGTEIWHVFHATSDSRGACDQNRYSMAQKVTFGKDGMPVFGNPQRLGAMLEGPSGEQDDSNDKIKDKTPDRTKNELKGE